jgi:hypothetical protein
VAAATRTDRVAGEHAAAFLLRLWRLGQLRLRRQFAWRENGAVVLRRSPRSRQDSAVSLRGDLPVYYYVAEAYCPVGKLAND